MHRRISYSAYTVASFLLASGQSYAQDLAATIVGCADVQCPTNSSSTAAQCTLVDKTFTVVGLSRIPVNSSSLSGISWVEGVAVEDGDNDRSFDTNFYLGTPQGLSLTNTGACAVFFTQVSDAVAFDDSNEEEAEGTCQEAMSSECVDALIQRARAVNVTGISSSEACARLQSEFEDNLDSACTTFATNTTNWSGIVVKPLSGSEASEPISSAENATSNCWPILPKTDNLTLVNSVESTGDFLATTLKDKFFQITPILTLFYPGSANTITQAEAQMTCMKTMGTSAAANSTKSGNDENQGSSDAGILGVPGSAALLVATVLVLLRAM